MRHSVKTLMIVLVTTLAAFAVAAGCGDGGDSASPKTTATTTVTAPGGLSSSSVAPNTFLTFQNQRYRLISLEQANLIDESQFEQIGVASEADIDQKDLTLYRRQGDADAVYTYSPAQPPSPEIATVEGESGGTPALWYRWVPEP